MKKGKQGEGTLLTSVLLSAPGPLVLAMALIYGRSSTQMADFIRRSLELTALIVSYGIFRYTTRTGRSQAQETKLLRLADLFVGGSMCLSGPAILFLALTSFGQENGNVLPGLVIALLGVAANGLFYLRYSTLYKNDPHSIFLLQKKLYRAKFLVDMVVSFSLSAVLLFPDSPGTSYIDLTGSVAVSLYLVLSSFQVLRGQKVATDTAFD